MNTPHRTPPKRLNPIPHTLVALLCLLTAPHIHAEAYDVENTHPILPKPTDTSPTLQPKTTTPHSAHTRQSQKTTTRPKIGLVLSGGGARGLAHIGVLRALEAQHIPIDYIAGTSAGALVGGMYASGMSVDEIEQRIQTMDFEKILFETNDRRNNSQYARDIEYQGNGVIDLSITREGAISLPKSVVNGAQVEEALRGILKNYPNTIEFNRLPIPFRAVASDLSTGKIVELKQGQLAQALRASMSIPAVFAPIEIDGQLLTDGMVASNLPIQVAKNMGAERIIAIDVGTDLLRKQDIKNVVNVSEQLVNILVQRNIDEERKLLGRQDHYLKINVGDIGNLAFNRINETVQAGYNTLQTPSIQTQLHPLSLSPSSYQAHLTQRAHRASQESHPYIHLVRVETNGIAHPETLQKKLRVQPGTTLNIDELNADIQQLQNLNRIESITYSLNPLPAPLNTPTQNTPNYELVYHIHEQDSAKNSVRAGVEITSNKLTNQKFALHLAHRNVWLNTFGGEWRNYLTIGSNSSLKTELNQPLSTTQNWFIRPQIHLTLDKHSVYQGENTLAVTDYSLRRHDVNLKIGQPIEYTRGKKTNGTPIGEWSTGIGWHESRISQNLSNPAQPIAGSAHRHMSIDTQITLDQLDNPNIPTQGYFAQLYSRITPQKTSNKYPIQAGLHTIVATTLKRKHAIGAELEIAGQNLINSHSIYTTPYRLGGYKRLSGYQQNQFIGNYLLYGNLSYRYISPWKILNAPLTIGGAIETGNTWTQARNINTTGLKSTATLFTAINTPIGPAQLAIGLTRTGKADVYFYLGRTFNTW